MSSTYKGYRFPREIISHCVWLYHRFTLSFREIELLMAARGIEVSYESIRAWCARFGPEHAANLRRRQPKAGDKWHLDEVFIKVGGVRKYLWRAVCRRRLNNGSGPLSVTAPPSRRVSFR